MKNLSGISTNGNQPFSYSLLRQSSYSFNKVVNKIPNWKDKNILIADSDETNACMLKNFLAKTKATLVNASNGKRAIELCHSSLQIDLVIMDVFSPEMKGCKAAKLIKTANSKLPVIAQASHMPEKEIKKALDAGCDGFLEKPVSQEVLFKVISKFLH
jgi:CheY-like chemotaxis protein